MYWFSLHFYVLCLLTLFLLIARESVEMIVSHISFSSFEIVKR